EFLLGELHDRPLLGLLGDGNVGLGILVLRRGHRTISSLKEPPHPEEPCEARRLEGSGPVLLLPILRDAPPKRGAPQDEGMRALVPVQMNFIPVARLFAVAHSPAPTLGPSAGWTRVTLMRPSGQTTVKPSAATSTTSPYLPPIPLGSLAGIGV